MYPLWSYFPRNEHAPPWVTDLVGVVAGVEAVISTETVPTGLSSDQVLQAIAPGLIDLGYAVESSKRRADKNFRPVLFGDNGRTEVSYEIDAFHDQLGIAVEVEAGRGAANNADYRDIVRTSLILDADYLALLMPIAYRSTQTVRAFQKTRSQLEAIYASNRLQLPFAGVLLIGY